VNNDKQTGFYSKEDLRNILRLYLTQYSTWMRFYIVSLAADLKDLEVIENRLFEIPIDIAGIFRIYYGDQAATQIENLLRDHIKLTMDLVKNTIAGDSSSFNHTAPQWMDNTKALSAELASINSKWNQNQFENLFGNLLSMTLDEANKRKNMQYADDVYQYDNIEYFVLMIADVLWNGFLVFYSSQQNIK
jgi:hypothetical protein